jgi:hypothetical protein
MADGGDGGTILAFPLGHPHGSRPGDTYPPTEVNPNESQPPTSAEYTNLPREQILVEAHAAIMGARHTTHGPAEKNLECTGELWAIVEKYSPGKSDGSDVAIKNILQKVSRLLCGERDKDHWKDIIGWAALGFERSGEADGNAGR